MERKALNSNTIVQAKNKLLWVEEPVGLDWIAKRLNLIEEEGTQDTWGSAKAIIEKFSGSTLLIEAIADFNKLAEENPMSYTLKMQKTPKGNLEIVSDYDTTSAMGSVLKYLWIFYFNNQGWGRLKKCLQCHVWFVDRNKNKSQMVCSKTCSNRYWNRERRKQANHKQYKRKED